MTKRSLVAAIDVGTGGTRTAVFDTSSGQLLAQSHQEYQSLFPHPAWVEQRAADWWKTACTTARKTLKKLGRKKAQLAAVSITNQRETIVPVDREGNPLHNALVWQDRRSTNQCEQIRKELGEKTVYNETGLTIDPYFSAPKILWFKEERPKLFQKTHKFLLVHDYILHNLTEDFATDYSNASRTMLFAVERFEWSTQICEELGIPKEKLPQVFPPSTLIGEVTQAAAAASGFPKGLPVVVGGGDQQCSAVGVGVVSKGGVKATVGTGTFILAYEDKPRFDDQQRLLLSCHAIPEKFVIEASIFTSGIIYRWFRDQFGIEEKRLAQLGNKSAYDLMNEQASLSPPGAKGILMLPHFVGAGAPYWNPNARGVLLGLALGHKRGDVIRSIMEGTTLEIRRNLEIMRSLGIILKELRLTGGATRSSIWNQILSDISGLPVQRSRSEEATALGAAILATVGLGIYRTAGEAANHMISIGEQFVPNPNNQVIYERLFSIQSEAYDALEKAKVFARLASLDL